jgi:hypothetical protein
MLPSKTTGAHQIARSKQSRPATSGGKNIRRGGSAMSSMGQVGAATSSASKAKVKGPGVTGC